MRSIHGPRRRWWWPIGRVCRCGLDWPCIVEQILDRATLDDPAQLYADGLAYARTWQADQRRRWRGAR